MTENATTCYIGGKDDGTLRVCCTTHNKVVCAHHYARTHFVETDPAWPAEHACSPLGAVIARLVDGPPNAKKPAVPE